MTCVCKCWMSPVRAPGRHLSRDQDQRGDLGSGSGSFLVSRANAWRAHFLRPFYQRFLSPFFFLERNDKAPFTTRTDTSRGKADLIRFFRANTHRRPMGNIHRLIFSAVSAIKTKTSSNQWVSEFAGGSAMKTTTINVVLPLSLD